MGEKSNIRTAVFGGRHSPEQVLLDALNHAEHMQCCVVIYFDKDEFIQTSWSDGSMLQRMGMAQVAALRMLEVAQEEDA